VAKYTKMYEMHASARTGGETMHSELVGKNHLQLADLTSIFEPLKNPSVDGLKKRGLYYKGGPKRRLSH